MRAAVEALLRGSGVTRYHTYETLVPEKVGQHSHGVAGLLLIIYREECTRDMLAHAVFHDIPEYETGDMPGHAKRRLGLGPALKGWEDEILEKGHLTGLLPPLSIVEKYRLKFCDNAQGALYCIRELRRGNRVMMEPLGTYIRWMLEMKPIQQAEVGLFGIIYQEYQRYEDDFQANGR